MVKLLLDNLYMVSPVIKSKIYDLDQCFSGYSQELIQNREMSDEDKMYVEQCFMCIYNYIKKQYVKNERKLYCSFIKRIGYKIQELHYMNGVEHEKNKNNRR